MSTLDSQASTNLDGLAASAARQVSATHPPRTALIPEVGVLALVPDPWHLQWQPRHQVMTRLSHYFPVIWPNPSDDWRQSLRLSNLRSRPDTRPIQADFFVHSPSPLLPVFYSPKWLADFTLRKRLEAARQVLLKRGCKKTVLYLWRPEFAAALDLLPFDLSCYHIDDEYSFSSVDRPLSNEERALITRVDQVFIHSPALLEKKGRINPHTAFAPNGVDFDAYSSPAPEPADLATIPHPRIGYSGHIKKQLDWPLLLDLTGRHPDWHFVFVGAPNAHPEITSYINELSRRSNVRFLGGKTATELAAYPQHFDVCIMPYRRDDYTKYIYPLKLHEYLASGRPVVGTPIASLEPFRETVRLPDGVDQWSLALRESLSQAANTGEARSARQLVAKQHDWDFLVQQIAEVMVQRLGPTYTNLLAQRQGNLSSEADRPIPSSHRGPFKSRFP
jgi:glycosyltransferase involved in cell wall biosynthesis